MIKEYIIPNYISKEGRYRMKIFKFYDTCSLLIKADSLFKDEQDTIVISSISLEELENIKTSGSKDEDTKMRARHLLRVLDENPDKYEIWIFKEPMLKPIEEKGFSISNDMRILATAIDYDNTQHPDETVFITNDLLLKHIANLFFGEDSIGSVEEEIHDGYTGFKEVYLSDEQMAQFYQNINQNTFDLYTNQYLFIYNQQKQLVDTVCWDGETHRTVIYHSFKSEWFGDVKPYKHDIYQTILADSLANNQITMVKGPAGSGKTYLSLGYLMNQLDRGKIDKIIVFCNTVATKNSAKLGYYPGTRDEKLLDSQIGNLLSSKLGGRIAVEDMIEREKLVLLPLSDIRGYDTSGMNAGIYISEAQNMDISLMKLTLQRIGEDSICIIDGDCKTQVDDISFAGRNNGMRRVSQIFRGQDVYGEVELQIIHRSKIAQIAEQL